MVMAGLGIIHTSISRKTKRAEVRLSETAEAPRRQSNSREVLFVPPQQARLQMAPRVIMGDHVSATLSVLSPAFNEEAYQPATLEHVRAAASRLKEADPGQVDIAVVANASTKATAPGAARLGARAADGADTGRYVVPRRNCAACIRAISLK